MQRKEISAIIENDFLQLLKDSNLIEKYQNKELLCCNCKEPIVENNIFAMFYENELQFCCNKAACVCFFEKRR
jgi:hypothetical protein